jgi:hypothetical protein
MTHCQRTEMALRKKKKDRDGRTRAHTNKINRSARLGGRSLDPAGAFLSGGRDKGEEKGRKASKQVRRRTG